MHAFDRRTDRQTDRQTDGRTDRNLIARPRLHCMQRGKKLLLRNHVVDFVEICNVCARKVIIEAAKRIIF